MDNDYISSTFSTVVTLNVVAPGQQSIISLQKSFIELVVKSKIVDPVIVQDKPSKKVGTIWMVRDGECFEHSKLLFEYYNFSKSHFLN